MSKKTKRPPRSVAPSDGNTYYTLSVGKDLIKKAKVRALESDTTVADVVRSALCKFVEGKN